MILYVDTTEYINQENTKNFGFKYELRSEDNTKKSYSRNSLLVAIRNFKKKYNLVDELELQSGTSKKEIVDK